MPSRSRRLTRRLQRTPPVASRRVAPLIRGSVGRLKAIVSKEGPMVSCTERRWKRATVPRRPAIRVCLLVLKP